MPRRQRIAVPSTNGHDRSPFAGFNDPIAQARNARLTADMIQRVAANDALTRFSWARAGGTDHEPDPRADVGRECGWPDNPSPELLAWMYLTDSIAARVVEFMCKESWQVWPTIKDGKYTNDETPFLKSLIELGSTLRGGEENWFESDEGHPLFSDLQHADVLSGINSYGVMFLGYDDAESDDELIRPVRGLKEEGSAVRVDQPDPKSKLAPKFNEDVARLRDAGFTVNSHNSKADKRWKLTRNQDAVGSNQLMYVQALPETMARVMAWETSPNSPRRNQPAVYQIVQQDQSLPWSGSYPPIRTYNVHWSRVVHYADWHHHPGPSRWLANSRQRCVMPELLDGRKISGAGGMAFWRNAMLKIFLETNPQLGGDVLFNRQQTSDDFENMMNGLQQWMFLRGVHANPVAPAVVDPSPHQKAKIERICIKNGWPVRIFVGSERGNLASTQDEGEHSDRVMERQNNYLSESVIARTINRLIMCGPLVAPKDKYGIEWPPVGSQDELKKAQVLLARTQAAAAFVAGNVQELIPQRDYLVGEMQIPEDRADDYLAQAEKQIAQDEADAQKLADKHGMVPTPPAGFTHPPPKEVPAPIKVKPGEKIVVPKPPKAVGAGDTLVNHDDDSVENYDPDEPRDDHGRWTSGGGPAEHIRALREVDQNTAWVGLREYFSKPLSERGDTLPRADYEDHLDAAESLRQHLVRTHSKPDLVKLAKDTGIEGVYPSMTKEQVSRRIYAHITAGARATQRAEV